MSKKLKCMARSLLSTVGEAVRAFLWVFAQRNSGSLHVLRERCKYTQQHSSKAKGSKIDLRLASQSLPFLSISLGMLEHQIEKFLASRCNSPAGGVSLGDGERA
jgi:hypothetical protein